MDLCERAGFHLEPFQRRIASAYFAGRREFIVLLARGNGKSALTAALAVHHLLTTKDARVFVAAASREQAGVIHEYARSFAQALDPDIDVNQREIRTGTGYLRVVASDAGKLQGLSPTLALVDELHAHRDADVYVAFRAAMQKRPGARLVVISTAGQGADSVLGRLRARALAQPIVRVHGCFTHTRGEFIELMEWMVPVDRPLDDFKSAKQANPASWLTEAGLREQAEALHEFDYQRYHLNRWVARIGSWLPAGAWAQCANGLRPQEGEDVWVGLDVGGARADTAVVWINRAGAVGCEILEGDDALMEIPALLLELAKRFRIRECVYDPWRAQMLAKIAEQHGIRTTTFAQSDSRMIPASAALHQAIVEKRIHHPADEKLDAHVAAAIARHGRRGWRVDQAERGANIDGLVALIMAFEAMSAPEPPPTRIWWAA